MPLNYLAWIETTGDEHDDGDETQPVTEAEIDELLSVPVAE